MKINKNRLVPENSSEKIVQENTSNKGGIIKPTHIIIHFTAGKNAESSVNWFKDSSAGASAHLVIAKNGTIYQLIDFNKKAWHAGTSKWAGLNGFNNFSIGIELDNPGRLTKVNDKYVAWFKDEYPENAVVEATHKHEKTPSYWCDYTPQQIEACLNVCKILMEKYTIQDILGHDDIAPYRKNDPGPLFPMENFRSRLFGRQDDTTDVYKINASNVNLRRGPGTEHEVVKQLTRGTKVEFMKSHMGWFYIFVAEKPDSHTDVVYGWVHSSLVTKI